MDPNEFLYAGPALVKGAGALAAVVPFTAIVRRMLGPAADEIAEMWRDQVRLYRYERQLKCVEKAERMAKDAGFTPQAVPLKILFPLLERASMEEDETLHDMWAGLLANAASNEAAANVRPGFAATLRQMSRDEAMLLNWMFEHRTGSYHAPFNTPFDYADLMTAYAELGFVINRNSQSIGIDGLAFETCLQSLEAQQLIGLDSSIEPPKRTTPRELTFRGLTFLFVVRPPKPKE